MPTRRRSPFSRLQTKLTVLFAALFGLTLLAISAAVYGAISSAALNQVRGELTASGTVFDRVWNLRSVQLRQGAGILARDFGFRAAVATNDTDTILSAMENLRGRFAIDLAFIIGVDATVFASDPALVAPQAGSLLNAFDDLTEPSGVAIFGGAPYQVIAAPILSPDLKGWVVFATRLDQKEMTELERLSAIPLEAEVLHKTGAVWAPGPGSPLHGVASVGGFIDRATMARTAAPAELATPQGPSLALVKPLPMLDRKARAVLLLRYPLAKALAPYHAMIAALALTGLLGMAVVIWGTWALARSLTRPIAALDEAANRLQRGEEARVEIHTRDEIGRLAERFNHMATEIRERERKITHLALHDDETDLPNRLAFERRVEALTAEGPVFVLALGVDRFAHMRGAIGYELAAAVMGMVGARAGALVAPANVARLSSDVLGCVVPARTAAEAESAALGLLGKLEEPVSIGGEAIDVALTLGLAPCAAGRSADAIAQAAIALDQARATRRKLAFFDAQAYGDPSSKLALMSGMLKGLGNGEIELFHQPKYDLRNRRIGGVEGLVRWRRADGYLPPDLFIPMAEETGHIRALTDWVLERAIEDQRTLARAGHELEMSVNISARLLCDRDFARFAVAEAAKAAGKICFEITETAVIENPDLALEMLDAFAEAGVAISIDDFGSGLSSLAYLKRIRGHELKIDKSIVEGVAESRRDSLIVRSTIDLAHSLGLKVTAEGVETEAAFKLLAAMGCDCIQGYLIARPQSLTDLTAFLADKEARARQYG